MKQKLSQLERIRGRLHQFGWISRNDCLRYFITRCAARIIDLETQGYVFRTEDTGRDFIYHLVSINGVPFVKPADLVQMLKDAAVAVEFFDNYPTKEVA